MASELNSLQPNPALVKEPWLPFDFRTSAGSCYPTRSSLIRLTTSDLRLFGGPAAQLSQLSAVRRCSSRSKPRWIWRHPRRSYNERARSVEVSPPIHFMLGRTMLMAVTELSCLCRCCDAETAAASPPLLPACHSPPAHLACAPQAASSKR